MGTPALLALLCALLVLAPLVARWLCRHFGLIKPNFQDKRIPASVGITFLLVALATKQWASALFGLLGLIDDRWGSRAVGGFRGHLKALFRGKPTTGSLKLVGGGVVALGAAWQHDGNRLAALLPDAALIALAANTLNLLDLRPGRAQFGFWLLALPSVVVALLRQDLVLLALLPIGLAALIEWRFDARAEAMMGDTGSNLLGATTGLAAVQVLPLPGRLALLALLLALNLAAERVSISRVIAQTPWLDALDRRLGVRAAQSSSSNGESSSGAPDVSV